MKLFKLSLPIILVVFLFTFGVLCKSDSPNEFELKFKTCKELATWLNANGHKAKAKTWKMGQIVSAIDGAAFSIDGKEGECYVFNSKDSWIQMPENLKNRVNLIIQNNQITNYYNAKCFSYK